MPDYNGSTAIMMSAGQQPDQPAPADPEAEKLQTAYRNLKLRQSADYINKTWDNYQLATPTFRRKLSNFYKQYRGIPSRRNYEGLANVFVNETLEATEAITAQEVHAIFSEPENLTVAGREPTDDQEAKLIGNAMYYYMGEMNFKSRIIRSLRQKNKYGTTVAQVSWAYEAKDITARTKAGIGQVKKVVRNHPSIDYVDLMDIALEPGKPDIPDMDWVIKRKRVSWDYIQGRVTQGLYSRAQVEKIQRGTKGQGKSAYLNNRDQNLSAAGFNVSAYSEDEYEILEGWCKVPKYWVDDATSPNAPDANEMVEAVIETVTNGPTLRLERNPYWHQEKPFLLAQMIQVDDEAFGIGVCEISEYLQMELNDKRNQLLDHATEQIAPPLIRNRAANISKSQIKIGPFQIIDSDVPGDGGLTPLKLGGNPMENVQMDQIIKQDIRNNTGATNPIQGVSSNKDQTAYEISTLQSRGSARIDVGTIDFSEKFLKRAYRLMYGMIQQYVDRKTMIRITGKDGVRWEQLTPEDVAIDVDLIPKVATDVDSRSIVRQQLIQFAGQLAPLYPRIEIWRIARKIYSLFGFDDVDEVIPVPESERGVGDLTTEQEIQVLAQGQKIEPNYWEDHIKKIAAYEQFLKQYAHQLSPEALAAFKDTISRHMQYLQILEQARATMGQGGAPGAPAPGGAPPAGPGAVQTPVSTAAQGMRTMMSPGGM